MAVIDGDLLEEVNRVFPFVHSHPWLLGMKELTDLLDGKVAIPHVQLTSYSNGDLNVLGSCNICREALHLCWEYLMQEGKHEPREVVLMLSGTVIETKTITYKEGSFDVR